MKSILRKVAVSAIFVLGMSGCAMDGGNNSGNGGGIEELKLIVPECILVSGGIITGDTNVDNQTEVFPKNRKVTLSSFYLGKYEVTQAQYKSVMAGQKITVGGKNYTLAASPSLCTGSAEAYKIDYGKDHANYPVENVNWYDAVYYCNVLSAKENLEPCYTITVTSVSSGHISAAEVTYDKAKNGYRLPTEAEWEYAARGGDPTLPDWNYTFSGAPKESGSNYGDPSNTGLDSVGWYCYNNITGITGTSDVTNTPLGKGTHEIGKKDANRLGLCDMSGNVSEWCYDLKGEISSSETVTNPIGASDGLNHCTRGGSWYTKASNATVSKRSDYFHTNRSDSVGFRVCRNAN